jgi:hypothetical protein
MKHETALSTRESKARETQHAQRQRCWRAAGAESTIVLIGDGHRASYTKKI